MKDIDILIIHLNGQEVIKNCLSSIYKDNPNASVFVLLNDSTDNSEEIIRSDFKKVKILKSEKRIGFAEACNILAKKSKAKYVVFLNNDVVIEKGWLKELYKTIKKHPNCVACQSKIKSYHERNKFEFAGAAGGFVDIFGFHFCRGRIFDNIEEDKGQFDDEIRIFWGCGVCLIVDRKFFIDSGMFDEDFFMYTEESDFCWRANLYGKEIWYSPKSIIYHIGSYSSANNIKDKKLLALRKDNFVNYYITRNHVLLLLKNYSFKSLLYILPVKIFLDFIGAVRFFPYKTISFIKSYLNIPVLYITRIHKKRKIIQKRRKINDKKIKKMMYKGSIALSYFLQDRKKFDDLKI